MHSYDLLDKERANEIIEEIRAVLRKHHVALIGTCDSEGILGEITIEPLSSLDDSDPRFSEELRLDDKWGCQIVCIKP